MSALIDTKFPSLESVAEFLDKLSTNEPTNTFTDPVSSSPSCRSRNEPKEDLVLSSPKLTALLAEKSVLEHLALTESRLADPSSHEVELVKSLDSFISIQADSTAQSAQLDLAKQGESMIREQWLNNELKSRLNTVKKTLTSAKWPQKPLPAHSPLLNDVLASAVRIGSRETFQVLVKPIADRIRFHFQQSSDTKRVDKPEWMFSYVVKQLHANESSFTLLKNVTSQPIDQVIVALTPVIAETYQKTYGISVHSVRELLTFVLVLESQFWCSPNLSTDQLITKSLTTAGKTNFLQHEQLAYTKAAQNIVVTSSQNIDFDADAQCAKPTFVAVAIAQLLANSAYLLRLPSHEVFPSIHRPTLSIFLEHLESQQEKYTRRHSSLARAVGTATDKDAVRGKAVLGSSLGSSDDNDRETLARIFGSASFLVLTLENMAISYEFAKYPRIANEIAEFGARFAAVRDFASEKLAALLQRDAQRCLKQYFQVDWQNSPNSAADALRSAIQNLKPQIAYLNHLCPSSRADKGRVLVPFATLLAKLLWQMVIQANVFTEEAAKQLSVDFETLWQVLDLPIVSKHLANLEAVQVLLNGKNAEVYELLEDQVDGLLRRRRSA